MAKSKSELTPALLKQLVRAIRRNPSLTDVADECGVNPRTLQHWVKKGLYPNPEPLYGALATAARHSRAVMRGNLFGVILNMATGKTTGTPDPKWAQYVLERLDEDGEISWQSTIPGPEDRDVMLEHLFANPTPEMLAAAAKAGKAIVDASPVAALPAPIVVEGTLEDE